MSINHILKTILENRGIKGEEEIAEFLSEKPQKTYDPFLLYNMQEAVDLILKTVNAGGKICIYGDYDVDGVTSITILRTVLESISDKIDYFVPNRFQDGYGLNKKSIENIKKQGCNLIITVDCGITSVQEVAFAKEIGMDIIVTDHHTVPDEKPDCLIINPKQKECEYPCKNLAGCGVAFKIAQAIIKKEKLPRSILNRLLDIVAIGTIADIVPLIGENRTIVKYGLNQVNKSTNEGVIALKNVALRNPGYVSSENISFNLAPHINSAGRLESASISVDLLNEKDPVKARKIAYYLENLNQQRKDLQNTTFETAKREYEKRYKEKRFPMIVLDEAHEGIAGIVAGKLKDYCYKPVAILTDDGKGNYKATCRSTDKIDIYMILKEFNSLYVKFGGHKAACGFTIPKENFEILVSNVDQYMKNFDYEDFEYEVNYDLEISGDDISIELIEALDKIEPYGCCNEKPVFLLRNCEVNNIYYMGENSIHMKVIVQVDGYKNLNCILFNYTDEQKDIFENNQYLDIYGSFNINEWNGNKTVQLFVDFVKRKI